MKTIIMIIALGMLFSCTEQEVPTKAINEAVPYGSSLQLEAIRKDIQTKYNSLSLEQKLDLCLQQFYLADPEYHKNLLENRPESVKAVLLENELFVKICRSRKIDPNDIPDDYFAAEKPAFMTISEMTELINSK